MRFLKELAATSAFLSNHEDVLEFSIVGSACVVDKPKDLDILVLVNAKSFINVARWMFGSEWDLCGDEYDDQDDKWGALRNGNVNLIVTVDRAWFTRGKLANEVCTALKLTDKGDRIVAHRVIRDGYSAEAANQRRNGAA